MFTPADTISIPTSRLKENIPDIAAITGNTLWGFSLLLSKTALNYTPTSILLSMRFIIAFLLMNLILLFKIERISLKGKNILPVLLLALNDVAYFYCESYGIALTNSMFTGVVLSLIPILALANERYTGNLADAPTLSEVGDYNNVEVPVWRGVAAPAAMSDEAAAYWSEVLGSVSETDAWKNEYIDANKLIADYMDTTAATEYVTKYEADYMAENGLK